MKTDLKQNKMKGDRKESGQASSADGVVFEKGFIPYCKRFMNTMREAYKDIYTL